MAARRVGYQGTMRSRRNRADYERGLPGYHDPTAGFGGSSPALSALTLRAWLAGFGVLACVAGAVLAGVLGQPVLAVVFGVVAVFAAGNLAWVLHRKRRGEPG